MTNIENLFKFIESKYPEYKTPTEFYIAKNPKNYFVDNDIKQWDGDLDLDSSRIQSLGSLKSVGGVLNLDYSSIQSLGDLESVSGELYLSYAPIKSLGNLKSVGGNLDFQSSQIEDLGNLKFVGGDLYLFKTPLSKKYSEEEIRKLVDVKGEIWL